MKTKLLFATFLLAVVELNAQSKTAKPEKNDSTAISLLKYTGDYLLNGGIVKIYIKEPALMAIVPGQGEFTLEPVAGNEFAVKEFATRGFIVNFETDQAGVVAGFIFTQPGAAKLKAKKINDSDTLQKKPLTKDELAVYTGEYELPSGVIKIDTSNNALSGTIAGQPPYELIPSGKDRFTLKGVTGYSIFFERNNKDIITSCIITQPGGNITARKKK